MRNAKEEFLDEITGRKVRCVQIMHGKLFEETRDYNLKEDYTREEYDTFLESIDFIYDSGYGTQELYGTIWFTDDAWSTRHEYDGSECWETHKYPRIPISLRVD